MAGTTITVNATYSQAVANDKTGADVSVEDGKLIIWNGVNVTDSNRETLLDLTVKADGENYKATVLGDNGLYYDVTLTQAPAATGAEFAAGTVADKDIVKTPAGGNSSLNAPDTNGSGYQPILQWLKTAKLNANSQTANVEWTINLNNGGVITGTGVGNSLQLTPSIYNETSNDVVTMVTAIVTSEDGKTTTFYCTGTIPATVNKFDVSIGDGIYVFDDGTGNTWNGVNTTGTQSTDFTVGTRKLSVTVGSNKVYMLVSNSGEGTWNVTGAGTVISNGVQNGMSWARVTFTGTADVQFEVPATPTILNVTYGGGLNPKGTAADATHAEVTRITSPAKKGEELVLQVDLNANTHIADFVWFNGTQSGKLEETSPNYWSISAAVTNTMDTSKPVILVATVVSDTATLSITNNSSAPLTVEYLNSDDLSKMTVEVVAANGGTLTVTSKLDTRGPVTITAGTSVDITNSAAASTPGQSALTNVQTWTSGNLQGNVTLVVADHT